MDGRSQERLSPRSEILGDNSTEVLFPNFRKTSENQASEYKIVENFRFLCLVNSGSEKIESLKKKSGNKIILLYFYQYFYDICHRHGYKASKMVDGDYKTMITKVSISKFQCCLRTKFVVVNNIAGFQPDQSVEKRAPVVQRLL